MGALIGLWALGLVGGVTATPRAWPFLARLLVAAVWAIVAVGVLAALAGHGTLHQYLSLLDSL